MDERIFDVSKDILQPLCPNLTQNTSVKEGPHQEGGSALPSTEQHSPSSAGLTYQSFSLPIDAEVQIQPVGIQDVTVRDESVLGVGILDEEEKVGGLHAPVDVPGDYSSESKIGGFLYRSMISSESQQYIQVESDHTVNDESLRDAKTTQAVCSSSFQPHLAPAFIDDSKMCMDGDLGTGSQGKQSDLSVEANFSVDNRSHLEGIQSPPQATDYSSHSLDSVVDEGHQGKALLEMLSVAVESLENMTQEGNGSMENESPDAGSEAFVNCAQLISGHVQNCASGGTSSLEGLTGKLSELTDKLTTSEVDIQNKDHFLNMLCELTAVQQQEHESSDKPLEQVPLNIASLINDNVTSGELKRISFVDLLRKQMVHAGATTTDAQVLYEQLVHYNWAFLGKASDNQVTVFSLNVPTDGPENLLETEQSSLENSYKSGGVDLPTLKDKSDSGYDCAKPEEAGLREYDDRDREGNGFHVGDLVWGKVKSHPWWPGQVFDAADASTTARKWQRPGRVLVAFFGDGTFNWMQQSHLIAFRPNFEVQVKQTTMKGFCRAVSEALGEVCRRAELGLRCSHVKGALYSKDEFPDANAGIRTGVRLRSHPDTHMSSSKLQTERALEFVKTVACCPSYSLFSGLEYAELTGHVYGIRKFILGSGKFSTMLHNMVSPQEKVQSSKRKNDAELYAMKRPHIDTDMIVEKGDFHFRTLSRRGHSPKIRIEENLSGKESNETRPPDTASKYGEEAKESTWLAKGKRLHVLSEDRGKKRSKDLESLGPLGDSQVSTEEANGFSSPEDDTTTLLDMTGYLFVKKKMKNKRGESSMTKDIFSSSSEKVDKVSVGEILEPLPDMDLEKTGAVEGQELSPNRTKVDELPYVQLQESFPVKVEHEDSHCTRSLGSIPSMASGIKETYGAVDSARKECTFSDVKESQTTVLELKNQSEILMKNKRLRRHSHSHESDLVSEDKKKRDDTPEKCGLSHVHTQDEQSKKPVKRSRLGYSIKKVAGVLKGTLLNKSADEENKLVRDTNYVTSLDSESGSCKIQVTAPSESFNGSLADIIDSLQAVAKDPVNSAVMRNSLQGVMSVFLKFRSMVFLKSPGYGSAGVGKAALKAEHRSERLVVVQHSSKASVMVIATEEERSSDDMQYPSTDAGTRGCGETSQSGPQGSQQPGLQELALAALKKSQGLQECREPAQVRIELSKNVPGQHLFKNRSSKKVLHPRHLSTSIKHHVSRPDSSSLLQKKSGSSAKAKASLGLFMLFPKESALPSEAELKLKFDRFGTLEPAGIRIFQDSLTVQVVYKHGTDAEVALQHARKNRMFGRGVSYMLRNFYPSGKTTRNSSFEKTNVKALDSLRRPQEGGTEPEVTLVPVELNVRSSLSVDDQESVKVPGQSSPSLHQEDFQSGTLQEDLAQSPPPHHQGGLSMIDDPQIVSPPPVSPPEDIRDQMMKLLQQVSILVSSSSLNQKPV